MASPAAGRLSAFAVVTSVLLLAGVGVAATDAVASPVLGSSPNAGPSTRGIPAVAADVPADLPADVRAAVAQRPTDVLVVFDSTRALATLRSDRSTAARSTAARSIAARSTAAAMSAATFAATKLSVLGARRGVTSRRDYRRLPIQLVRVETPEALSALAATEGVASLSLPRIRTLEVASSNLSVIRQPDAALAGHLGAGTRVAVLDTGVDYTLAGAVTTFGDCAGGPGTGTCRIKSYVDVTSSGARDVDPGYHGTHVAGVVATVAPAADLAVYNVFRSSGSGGVGASDSDILAALDDVAASAVATNTRSVNLSLGDGSHHDAACTDSNFASAFSTLRALGVVPVVSAGNGAHAPGSSASGTFVDGPFTSGVSEPACSPGALAVGASYPAASASTYTYGSPAKCRDSAPGADRTACFSQSGPLLGIVAPGVSIPAAGLTKSGTSQAAPHVAAAVAILASARPSATAQDIVSALSSTGPTVTDTRSSPPTLVRRLDVVAAVAALNSLTVPDAPTSATATSGVGQVVATWAAGLGNGGSALTGYTATSLPGGATCVTSEMTCAITGLSNGTAYTVSVTASNVVGQSASSTPSAAVTPMAPPAVLVAPTATAANAKAIVSWTPGDSGGTPITGFRVTASPGGAVCEGTASSCTVTGLANGTAYTFVVSATNLIGTSPDSAASSAVTPASDTLMPPPVVSPTAITFVAGPVAASAAATPVPRALVPGQPSRVVAVRGHRHVVVTWTPPPAGRSPITGYRVVAIPGGRSCTAAGTRCTITGLVNGRAYRFTVTAVNRIGRGRASSASAPVTPAAVPGAARGIVIARGQGRVTISWAAPAANGTPAITGYRVVATPGGKGCTTTSRVRRCTVTGLVTGRRYSFVVVAVNRVGAGPGTASTTAVAAADR